MAIEARMLAGLPEEEQQVMAGLLRKLGRTMTAGQGDTPPPG